MVLELSPKYIYIYIYIYRSERTRNLKKKKKITNRKIQLQITKITNKTKIAI